MHSLSKTVVLLLVPLVPAVSLYYIFGSLNSSAFGIPAEGVQTGGPIAAYLIVLYAGIKAHAQLSGQKDIIGLLKKQIIGDWMVSSASLPGGSVAEGKCSATITDDGDLSIDGELAYIDSDKKSTPLGSWRTLKIWREGGELRYVYLLTEPATNVEWCGSVQLNLKFTKRWLGLRKHLATMGGTWKVYGPTTKNGTLTYSRS
jgi:hypothetical protein